MISRTAALIVGTAFLLGLSGCASMSEDECRLADWQVIGYEDGMAGASQARIGDHRKACAEYGVVPDMQAYRAGHAEGLKQYCTESVGFERGRSGSTYQGVCPVALEHDFLVGYNMGREIYVANAAVAEVASQIESIDARIVRAERGISEKEAELIAEGTTTERRSQLLDEIRREQQRVGEQRSEKERLLQELGRLRAEAEAVEARYRASLPVF